MNIAPFNFTPARSALVSLALFSSTVISHADTPPQWNSIPPGIPAYGATQTELKLAGKPVATVQLSEPTVVSVATKPEGWGFFQFPKITRINDQTLYVRWSMSHDNIKSYGKKGGGGAVSRDNGKTWELAETPPAGPPGGLLLPNGDRLSVESPVALKVEDLKMPKPIGESIQNWSGTKRYFYLASEMPTERQGVYFKRLPAGQTEAVSEHATVDDAKAVKYSLEGLVPVMWSGRMHVAADGSIIGGIYPSYRLRDDGSLDPKIGVGFYRSTDGGRVWKLHGRIPYQFDAKADAKGAGREGFTEPNFEILADGTYLCILRTSDVGNGPMYFSTSRDQGVTWTTPKAFTQSGVLPQLLQLKNGVVVLTSGRPGVQLRFNVDGIGTNWTEPLEFFDYAHADLHTSCGYTSLLETGPDRFLMVYSDFLFKNQAGEIRKAIKVREIIVIPK